MELSLEQIRDAAVALAREMGVQLVVLFGSAARAEDCRPEDVDIGILGHCPLDPVDATNRLIRRLGVQQVDVVDLRRADPLLLALVARDGLPLFEATPGEFARFVSLAARRYADTRKFRDSERRDIQDYVATRRR